MRKRIPRLCESSTLEELRACLGLEMMNLSFQNPNTICCWEGPPKNSSQLTFTSLRVGPTSRNIERSESTNIIVPLFNIYNLDLSLLDDLGR